MAKKINRTQEDYQLEERYDSDASYSARELRQKKKKRGRLVRRVVILALEAVILAVLAVGLYVISKWDKVEHITITNKAGETMVVRNTEMDSSYAEEIKRGFRTIAIYGVDGDGYNCDVIMVASINQDTGEIRLSSIYRDSEALLQNGKLDKINQGMTHVADQSMKKREFHGINMTNVLNQNFDLDIEDFVKVDWYAVAYAITLLGGVDVDVTPAMLTEINGYITDTIWHTNEHGKVVGTGGFGLGTTQITQPGMQHLDGVQAVAYARIRHKAGSDFGRTNNQREIVSQMVSKAVALAKTDPSVLVGIMDAVFPYVQTTIDLPGAVSMIGEMKNYALVDMHGFPYYYQSAGEPTWNLVPTNLINNVSQLHEFLYGKQGYVPSNAVVAISQLMDEAHGFATSEMTPFSHE